MAWVTQQHVEAVFTDVADADPDQFTALINHLQGLAEIETGTQATPSAALKSVFTEMVYRKWRGLTTDPNVQQEALGSYSYSLSGLSLTSTERKQLKRAVGKTGLWVQPTTRGNIETPPRANAEYDDDIRYFETEPA